MSRPQLIQYIQRLTELMQEHRDIQEKIDKLALDLKVMESLIRRQQRQMRSLNPNDLKRK